MLDLLHEISDSLERNKLRTTLTGLSVSVGIFLLIVLVGAGNGIIHAFQAMTDRLPLHVVNMYPGQTTKPFHGMKEGRTIEFDERDLTLISQRFPNRISVYTPRLYVQSGTSLCKKGNESTADLIGVYPSDLSLEGRRMLEGRFINELDLKQQRKVMVISERQRDLLSNDGMSVLGKYVSSGNISFRIVGIYSNDPMAQNYESYIPFTTAQAVYGHGTQVGYLRFLANGVNTKEERECLNADVRAAEGRIHRFAPDDEGAVWIYNSSDGANEIRKAMNILHLALWILGLLTLLSGVVGVSNIMLITVGERTHEFGIRKALGAKPWSILRTVMLESVMITIFFGYVGLVAGVAVTEYLGYRSGQEVIEIAGMRQVVFLNPTVDVEVALYALLVLVTAGVLAGFVPARRAVRIKPIEALRNE